MKLRKRKWLVLAMTMLIGSLISAQTRTQAEPASIQGIVANEKTGQGLDGVIVKLTPHSDSPVRRSPLFGSPPGELSAQTNPTGRFTLSGIAPGLYTVTLSRQGFYETRGLSGSVLLRLEPGASLTNMHYQMAAHSVISGRVFNENNQPVSSVAVVAVRPQYQGGRRVLVPPRGASQNPEARAVTDEKGGYRLFGLEAGTYYIAVWGSLDRLTFRETPPAYYPGETDPEASVPISVGLGVEISSIDFRLRPSKLHVARFKLLAPTTPPYDCSRGLKLKGWVLMQHGRDLDVVHFADNTGVTNGAVVTPERDNTWVTTKLPRGSYELYHDFCPTLIMGLAGSIKFEIVDRDIEAEPLVIRPGWSLHGRITDESSIPVGLGQLRLTLRPLDARQYGIGLPYIANVAADGQFTFDVDGLGTIPNGSYWVDVSGIPADAYVTSITYGAQQISGRPLVVDNNQPGDLQLAIAGPGSTVEGIVQNAKDEPIADSRIVIFPMAIFARNPNSFKIVSADQFGRFVARGLAPKEYGVLAWADLEPGAYENAEFLGAFQARATRITATAGSNHRVSIQVLSRDQPGSPR